jgi:hypothetical protein
MNPVVELITFGPSQALRVTPPQNVARVATHFILLLDISESMLDGNKLENCKKCASLIVNFMTPEDRISLITFGEDAELHLKYTPAEESNKEAIKGTIQSIVCNGCTNLSAGLGYVRDVCEGTLKTGLLILTDGHANRGVHSAPELRQMIRSLSDRFSNLSVHCVAYGHDHNTDLLKGIAEDTQGSYNIVNTIEDTAFAFGETLGGLMSCAYQNVVVQVPSGSVVHGPYKIVNNTVRIGDVYAGTKPMILLDMTSLDVTVTGMTLPDLESWSVKPTVVALQGRDKDIELTKLRYTCTHIITRIRKGERDLLRVVDDFENALKDEFFTGHPVANLLKSEVETLRSMIRMAQGGNLDHHTHAIATQLQTSLGGGRGFSSPSAGGGRQRSNTHEDPSDAFQNEAQSALATLMRSASQEP